MILEASTSSCHQSDVHFERYNGCSSLFRTIKSTPDDEVDVMFYLFVVKQKENRQTDGVLTESLNIDPTKYDPYLRAHKWKANDGLFNRHIVILVDVNELGYSRRTHFKYLPSRFQFT